MVIAMQLTCAGAARADTLCVVSAGVTQGSTSVTGTPGADTIDWTAADAGKVTNGDGGGDTVIGGPDDDTIDGGDGSDTLTGSTPHDTVTGNAGNQRRR